jgi:hypothetical protein
VLNTISTTLACVSRAPEACSKSLRINPAGELSPTAAGGGLRRASGSADAALQLHWGRRSGGSLAAGSGSPLASPRGGRPATSKRASDTDVLAALREFRCLASDAEVMLKN